MGQIVLGVQVLYNIDGKKSEGSRSLEEMRSLAQFRRCSLLLFVQAILQGNMYML